MRAIIEFKRLLGPSAGLRINLLANYAGQGWTAIANIAFIPAYIHVLGVEAYGLIGVFAIILSAASLLDGGLTPTLNREFATFQAGGYSITYARDLWRTANIISLVAVVAIGILDLALAPALAHYWVGDRGLPMEMIVQSIFLMIAAASLRIIEGVQRGALLGLHRHVLLNLLSVGSVTLRAGGVLLPIIFISATPQMFFAWQAAISALSVLAFALGVHLSLPRAERRPRFDPEIIRTLRSFAGGVLGATALGVVLTQADKILLVKFITLTEFSAYALATAIAGGLYQLVAPVSQSFYPALTRQMAEGGSNLATSYHQGSQIVSATVGPPAAVLFFFAGSVLSLWTGNPALSGSAAPILSLLAVGTLCHCSLYMPYMLQLAAGWSGLAMRMNALAVIIVFPVLLFVVPRAGMVGAASVWVALNVASLLITVRTMHGRLLRTEMNAWYLNDVLAPIGIAFVVAGLCRQIYPASASASVRITMLFISCGATLIAGCCAAPLVRKQIAAVLLRRRPV